MLKIAGYFHNEPYFTLTASIEKQTDTGTLQAVISALIKERFLIDQPIEKIVGKTTEYSEKMDRLNFPKNELFTLVYNHEKEGFSLL